MLYQPTKRRLDCGAAGLTLLSDQAVSPFCATAQANALFLQGPVGPFFARIADDLRVRGFGVFKINLNGGDRFFFRDKYAYDYTGTVDSWAVYLEYFIQSKGISRIYMFGDCRKYHRVAKEIAAKFGVRVYVFEEGYIRPNFITLEEGGVNGFSALMQQELDLVEPVEDMNEASGNRFSFLLSVMYCILYYWACAWHGELFKHYEHHRPLGWLAEGYIWVRSAFRKICYRRRDQKIYQQVMSNFDGEYFLCPLQVHCDMQVLVHSRYKSLEHFIVEVLSSFAKHAPTNKAIVFKHHPLDRGYTDYTLLLDRLTREFGLQGRAFYVHDVCLPTLLKNACGSVMINSTVGMSSLFHGTPVKVLGDAIYNKPELTSQLNLDEFWAEPGTVNSRMFAKFRAFLVANNQLNGSLYVKLNDFGSAGVLWPRKLLSEHSSDADLTRTIKRVPELRLVGGTDVIDPENELDRLKKEEPRKAA